MPFEYRPDETFEPSSSTKQWYLFTHKTEHSFGGVPLPGLFDTTHYDWQIIGVVAIVLLEGAATYWASQQGVIITAILASIFIDFALAIGSHLFLKPIQRLRNELVFSEDVEESAKKRVLHRLVAWQRILFLLILVSALFKFYWFFSVYRTFDATSLFVLTCYLIGAILHITCTGYAFFTFIFDGKINREHHKYVDSLGKAFAYNKDTALRRALGDGQFERTPVGKHRVDRDEAGKYWLYTFGVLTDPQLRELIAKQPQAEQKRALAIEGVRHQVAILNQGPESGGE